jgi:hypothetical protein
VNNEGHFLVLFVQSDSNTDPSLLLNYPPPIQPPVDGQPAVGTPAQCAHIRTTLSGQFVKLVLPSVEDPDPDVFGPHGSVPISQGNGSGTFPFLLLVRLNM